LLGPLAPQDKVGFDPEKPSFQPVLVRARNRIAQVGKGPGAFFSRDFELPPPGEGDFLLAL